MWNLDFKKRHENRRGTRKSDGAKYDQSTKFASMKMP
jgi:hypothetical protein